MATSVYELCRDRGISAEQLSEQSGLVQERITAIILGRWTPSPSERSSIAGVFAVAADAIAWGHKTPIQHLHGHGPG